MFRKNLGIMRLTWPEVLHFLAIFFLRHIWCLNIFCFLINDTTDHFLWKRNTNRSVLVSLKNWVNNTNFEKWIHYYEFVCVFFFKIENILLFCFLTKVCSDLSEYPGCTNLLLNCKNNIKVSIPLDPSRVGFLPEDLAFRPVFLFVWLFFKQPLLNIIASIQTSQIYRSMLFVCCAFLFYLVLLSTVLWLLKNFRGDNSKMCFCRWHYDRW